MKVETVGKLLIAAGALVFVYAQTMSVSIDDSGIANIHLMAERQNAVIFGGFLFLAGVILYAVFKLKQTKEDVDIADKARQERTEAAKSLLDGTERGSTSNAVRLALGVVFGAYSALLLVQLLFLTIAWIASYFLPAFLEVGMTGVVAIAVIAYAFRKITIKQVAIHLAILGLVATATLPLRYLVIRAANNGCVKWAADGGHGQNYSEVLSRTLFCAEFAKSRSPD